MKHRQQDCQTVAPARLPRGVDSPSSSDRRAPESPPAADAFSHTTITELRRMLHRRDLRKLPKGLLTSRSPCSVIAKTPQLIHRRSGLWLRKVRKRESASPSKSTEQSIQCSSTLGPASEPSLVTCPTMTIATPRVLAKRVQISRRFAPVPRCQAMIVHPPYASLDGVNYHQLRLLFFGNQADLLDADFRQHIRLSVGRPRR